MAADDINTPFKRCSVCSEEKPATTEFFHPNKGGKYGLRGQCIPCRRGTIREQIKRPEIASRRKAYHEAAVASGKYAEWKRNWRIANPESARESKRKHVAKFADRYRERALEWRNRNREKVRDQQGRAYRKEMSCPANVLKRRFRARLRAMLKGIGSMRTEEILGYSKEQLAAHIQRQFTAGMTWEKLMAGEIHIDHIVPVSSFNISGVDCPEFRACWSLPNLRPMWAKDNQRKQAKIEQLL